MIDVCIRVRTSVRVYVHAYRCNSLLSLLTSPEDETYLSILPPDRSCMAKEGATNKNIGGAVGNGEPRLRNQRKRPRRCAIGCYHASAVFLLIGIIVALAGVSSSRLFEIFIYDNRHPPLFHHISIHVGLFDVRGEITGNEVNPVVEALEYPPVLDGMCSDLI